MHCRKVSELLSQAQDRDLSRTETVALYLHLGMCRHCRNFSRQMKILRQATQAWRKELEQ